MQILRVHITDKRDVQVFMYVIQHLCSDDVREGAASGVQTACRGLTPGMMGLSALEIPISALTEVRLPFAQGSMSCLAAW